MPGKEDVYDAGTPSEVHAWLISRISAIARGAGFHLAPLQPSPEGPITSILHRENHDHSSSRASVLFGVAKLLSTFPIPNLFAQPRRCLRIENHIDWREWLRSDVYQEHFRDLESARQFVIGLTDAFGAPLAFFAASTGEGAPALTEHMETEIVRSCTEAERALHAFQIVQDWGRCLDDILEDIGNGLPLPTVLIDASGRVIWMNREAEIRTGVPSISFGATRFYCGGSLPLQELVACARMEIKQPGAGQSLLETNSIQSMRPNETLIVRRIQRHGHADRAMVCICPRPFPRGNRAVDLVYIKQQFKLSAREAEISILAAEGYSVLNIAHRLNVAESTIASHLKRIYRKLDVASRVEMSWKLGRASG